MKQYIRRTEKNSIGMSIMFIILALILIFKAVDFITIIIRLFGMSIIALGIFLLVTYYRIEKEVPFLQFNLWYGIVAICFGIFCILKTIVVQNIFPIVIGVWIIVQGARKFQLSSNLKLLGEEEWIGTLITAIMSLVLGMIIICNPFASSIAITTIGGILLLINEVLNICESIWILRNIK